MTNKYDATESKKRRIQFLVLMIVSAAGYGLTVNLTVPTTSLEENLLGFAKCGFLLVYIIAWVGILANLFAELNHVFNP